MPTQTRAPEERIASTRATAATLELASELRVSLMRLTRRLRAERPDAGLTLTQLAVLGTLERHGVMSSGELAAHEKVRPPSMSRTAAGLEELALVTRTPHPIDKRQVLLQITPAGLDLVKQDRRRREAWLSEKLAMLTQAERELLRSVAPLLDRLARS
jgi:DNA-binding MarR family transcriptional regulator